MGDKPLCHFSGKIDYGSQRAAKEAARGIQTKRKGKFAHDYHCQHCGGWHISSMTRKKAREKGKKNKHEQD